MYGKRNSCYTGLVITMLLPFSTTFAQDVCVVSGDTLQQAIGNYAAACTLDRIDCDPFDGEWYCASFQINSSTAPSVTVGVTPVTTIQAPEEQPPEAQQPEQQPEQQQSDLPVQATAPTEPATAEVAAPVVQSSESAAPLHPVCVSALSDSDGDGYGWENSQSCIVTSASDAVNAATPEPIVAESTDDSPATSSSTVSAVTTTVQDNTNVSGSVNSSQSRFVSTGLGQWGNPIGLPSIPVAAANLPDGRILTWAAYNGFLFTYGEDNGRTVTTLFDPSTGSVSESIVTNIDHDMFCPGASMLADGRVMVTGGSSVARSSLFNPVTGAWSRSDQLNVPRAYNSNTTLHDGSVMTLGGSWAQEDDCKPATTSGGRCPDKIAEIWSAGDGWRTLAGISSDVLRTNDKDGLFRSDNHMWLFAVPGGRVLHAGPSRRMHLLDISGNGSVNAVGNRGNDNDAMNGIAVMYDAGKILTTGGAPDYEDANASRNATVIEVNGSNVSSRRTESMAFSRAYHNSVVLPNGEVIIAGGQAYPVPFSDNTSVLAAELWNPVNETFRTLATMSTPRNYHSIAILLLDGRVLLGGGGLCGDCTTNHADVEIFTPPYLLDSNGNRISQPRIQSAPSRASYGSTITVNTDQSIASFALVRMAAVTHSVNNDQRRVPLSFRATGNNNFELSVPGDRGVAPPGNYFLFALNQAGTPSVASVINIQ